MVLKTQSFATGGWGPNEAFGEPGTRRSSATACATRTPASRRLVAHTVISRSRGICCATTRDARYGDSMERVLYNTILGRVADSGRRHVVLLLRLREPPGRKVWYRDKWPCCSGTFPQLAADYHISTYLRSADGVYVNLFTPSSVRWTEGAATMRCTQETTIRSTARSRSRCRQRDRWRPRYTCGFRRWAMPAPVLSVNGTRVRTRSTRDVRRDSPDVARRRPDRAGVADAIAPRARGRADTRMRPPSCAARWSCSRWRPSQPAFEKAELLRAKAATGAAGDYTATCGRREGRRNAPVHEDPGGDLHHLRLVEIVRPKEPVEQRRLL